MNIQSLPETRRSILHILKNDGSKTIAELASQLNLTEESIRQHLLQLRHEGYVQRYSKRELEKEGRPSIQIRPRVLPLLQAVR
ncbi:regulatory protein, arsR family [Seinonella peptonophila]|uniref:Regulatory protein, arsR family n=1 Tax=Seinonella peptonophila TaxID=112248 RepID=A0A1M5AFN6_9BACL|nr:ArsR family transcriptional regulator [Seinonella peptonophila]SHF28692.1 regulatory protein, arsR family [Seinonella peptonophila]